jgi:Zn-dependent metalloprotease
MKNILRTVLLAMTLNSVTAQVSSKQQVFSGLQANEIFEGSKVVRYSDKSKAPTYIGFGERSSIKSNDAIATLRKALNMSMDEDLVIYRSENDQLGYTHKRYQQYYKNIKVEMGEYLTHEKDGNFISANGLWLDHINMNVIPKLSEQNALKSAIKKIGASVYKWEVAEEETAYKNASNNPSATYYPKGELVIISKDFDFKKREMHLCYKFDVFAQAPVSRNWIYIDAMNGEVIATEDRIESVDVPATGTTLYSGVKPMLTSTISPGIYQLNETTRGLGIETRNLHNNSYTLSTSSSFTNNSTTWNIPTNKDNAAHDAQWGVEAVYDYYQNVHGRNSIDNAGMKLTTYVHYGINENNSYHMPGGVFALGDGTGSPGAFNPLVSCVIVAHEFTHGVTEFSAMLHYGGESAALNESFSDILGTAAEFYIAPLSANYLIGDQESVTAGNYIRNLANPNAKSHPDTYLGTYWSTSLNITTLAHTNTGVQNFWFYLLCNGGTGTNDFANTYTVNNIGMSKVEKIAYRSLTTYLTRFANYNDARECSIHAAEDLYGVCSPEVKEVTNAWYAVGVGPAYSAAVVADFVANGVYSCSAPFTVNFTNLSSNDLTNSWNFGDGNTSTNTNPSNTYLNPGIYSVQLTATSPCGTNSITKNAYITVSTPPTPTVTGASACGSNSLNLSAAGSGTLKWYTASTGGSPINVGPNYTTPVLGSTTNYYVANEIAGSTGTLGAVYTGTASGLYGSVQAQFVTFNVQQACTLRTVKTNVVTAGKRNVIIYNGAGNQLANYNLNLPVGVTTLTLNMPLQPGTGYRIGGDTLDFVYELNPGTYPYNLAGVASIVGNTVGNAVYLWFYEWQVETAPCVSMRSQVTATIKPTPTITVNNGAICSGNSFTMVPGGASTYTYSGGSAIVSPTTNASYNVTGTSSLGCVSAAPAISSVTVNPLPTLLASTSNTILCSGQTATLVVSGASTYTWNTAGTGSSIVVSPTTTTNYSVNGTDGNGCMNSTTITQSVSACTGINNLFVAGEEIRIYPSPGKGLINVDLNNFNGEPTQIQIANALGQIVLSETIQQKQAHFNIESFSQGIYFVKILQPGKQQIIKLIKE